MKADFEVFGRKFSLETGPGGFLRDDSLWRVGSIYERYLCATSLPLSGVALDIGAGFGAFAVPFAVCFPGWHIWCFEPNKAAFEALCANIKTHGLDNITAFDVAVGAGADRLPDGLPAALEGRDATTVRAMAQDRLYFQHKQKTGFVEVNTPRKFREDFERINLPEISADALCALSPDFLKLTAPGNETNILTGLGGAGLSFLVGETWSYVPSDLVYLPDGAGPQSYLPLAGSPPLCLRHQPNAAGLEPGLDIVLSPATGEEKLSIHSHIAFADRSQNVDPEVFHYLLELARYSGADIVQVRMKTPRQDAWFGKWFGKSAAPEPLGLPFGAFRAFCGETAPGGPDQSMLGPRVFRRDYLDYHQVGNKIRTADDPDRQTLLARSLKNTPEVWYLERDPKSGNRFSE